MALPLIRSTYKVERVLYAESDYAAVIAIDVTERQRHDVLLNIYEGANARSFARCFDRLQHCPEFKEIFITSGALIAVFAYTDARDIDAWFMKGSAIGWRERLDAAESLLHRAMLIFDLPTQVACSALLSENLGFKPGTGFVVNFRVQPAQDATAAEFMALLGEQLRKILVPRLEAPDAEIAFVRQVCAGSYASMASLYSRWRMVKKELEADYEALYATGGLPRALTLAKRWLRRLFRPKGGA